MLTKIIMGSIFCNEYHCINPASRIKWKNLTLNQWMIQPAEPFYKQAFLILNLILI
jgi:hypothetical protein